jgi:hypothetical protein
MIRKGIALGLILAVAGGAVAVTTQDSKYTVKQVMKLAHGGGPNSLLKKVQGGKASAQEKAKLVELYEALAASKPKKGDQENYTKLCEALLDAAKAAQKGEKGAAQLLNKTSNCMACHNQYK